MDAPYGGNATSRDSLLNLMEGHLIVIMVTK